MQEREKSGNNDNLETFGIFASIARNTLPFVRNGIGSSHQLQDDLSEGHRVHTKGTNVFQKVEKYILTCTSQS